MEFHNFIPLIGMHIIFTLVRAFVCLNTQFCRVIYIGSYKMKSCCMLFGNEFGYELLPYT